MKPESSAINIKAKCGLCPQPRAPFEAVENALPQSWTLHYRDQHACKARIPEDEQRCDWTPNKIQDRHAIGL
jgi:hypothetical protein